MEHIEDVRPHSGLALRDRLRDWWNGSDSCPPPQAGDYKNRLQQWWRGASRPESDSNWTLNTHLPVRRIEAHHAKKQDVPARLIVSQALWGEGNLSPGPAEFITNMMVLLRLTPEMSMLDLGAGLGGPSRAINAAFGIWITALEWEAEIAAAGMEQSIMHGMGRKVPVTHFDPATAQKQVRKIDCFFSKDALHLIEDKHQILSAVKAAFKARGQFCILDFIVTDKGRNSPHVAAWNEADEHVSHFWTREQYAAAFKGLGLHLRGAEDKTEQYCEMIADGFRKLTSRMHELVEAETEAERKAGLLRALAFESNRWAVRAEALHSGDIAAFRFGGDTG